LSVSVSVWLAVWLKAASRLEELLLLFVTSDVWVSSSWLLAPREYPLRDADVA
jgi:hypothetical protein